jgi:trimethylamine--corrinoid protein Co-methyltransferase
LQRGLERCLTALKLNKAAEKKNLSIVLVDITNPALPRMAYINPNEMMYAASLPKIAILLGAFDRIAKGEMTLDDETREKLALMIRNSSNQAATEILNEVGICIPEADVLTRLKHTGLPVDDESQMVRFPADVLDELLQRAPPDLKLYARDGETPVPFDAGPRFMGSGTPVMVFDLGTGERRPSTRQDVIDMVRLEDALPNVDIVRPTMTATDVPGDSGLVEIAESFRNSGKHLVHRVLKPENVDQAVAVAAAVAGGEEALRQRPIFSVLYCPISPSFMTTENIRNVMGFASHGVPVTVLSMAMGGASAPATLLGELLVINTEVIGYIAAIQALYPGAPVLYGSVSSVLDMRTGLLPLGVPESGLIHAGCAALARFYGLRSMCAGFRSDAKRLDAQAAFEKVLTVLPVLQAGADIIYGIAATDSGGTASFVQAVLDDQMADGLRRILQGIGLHDLDDEVAMIKRLTPRGNFLTERHTRDHYKGYWRPRIFTRDSFEAWQGKGQTSIREAARQRARELLAEHQPAPLSAEAMTFIEDLLPRKSEITGRSNSPPNPTRRPSCPPSNPSDHSCT